MDVNPIAAQDAWDRWRRIVGQIRDECHHEYQRKYKNTERRNPILGVSDQEAQRRQCAEERKRLISLSDRQILNFHAAQNNRRRMKSKARGNRRQSWLENRVFFVEDREYGVEKANRI